MATTRTKAVDPLATDKKDDAVTETPTASNNSGVTFSHKPVAGFDSALLVFKAETPSDLLALYQDPSTKDVIEWSAKVDVFVKEEYAKLAPKAAAAAATGGADTSGRPANAGEPEERFCKHGKMTFRSGTNAKGTWKGFFCPTPKDTPGQCKAEFLR